MAGYINRLSRVMDYEGSKMESPTHYQAAKPQEQVAPFISPSQVSPKDHGKNQGCQKPQSQGYTKTSSRPFEIDSNVNSH
jgi:hypothetical protein